MEIFRGSQSFTGDGTTAVFVVTLATPQPDNLYTVVYSVLDGSNIPNQLTAPTSKVFRVEFASPPPALAPAFTIEYILVHD